jgi:hypothetical protein
MPDAPSKLARLVPQRFPPWTKALLCTAFCALGVYVFAGVVDEVYPIDDWLVWPLGAVWLWCLVLNLALFAFGTLLTSRIVGENTLPPLEMAVTSTAVGVVGMGMLMYLAGFLGLLHAWFAVLVVGVMLGLGARPLARLTRRLGAELASMPRPRTLLEHVLTWTTVGWAAWCLTFLYLGSMTPDAINHDASWYHIPIAEDYARAGRIIPFPADYLRAMPHLMSLLYSWAFLVPGLPDRALRWMLTLHIEFSMVMWTLAAVAAGARWMLAGRRVPLLWATFLLFPGIYVYDLHIGGSADHFLGLFTVPCFLATVRAAERFETRRCVLLGVLCAGAVLTKYQALYLLAASAVILVPRWGWLLTVRVLHRSATLRPRLRPAPTRPWALLTGPGSTALVGLLLTAPHFLKNVAFYRNPIYPFAQEVFTQSRPSFETSARPAGVRSAADLARSTGRIHRNARLGNDPVRRTLSAGSDPADGRGGRCPVGARMGARLAGAGGGRTARAVPGCVGRRHTLHRRLAAHRELGGAHSIRA